MSEIASTTSGTKVIYAEAGERATFLRKTYLVLAAAIFSYSALILFIVASGIGLWIARFISGAGSLGLLFTVLGFIGISYLAQKFAANDASIASQVTGLGVFTILEALITTPLILEALIVNQNNIFIAGLLCLGLFGGLTLVAFTTNSDFNFIKAIVLVGFLISFFAIIASIIFQFSLGIWFSAFMLTLAAGSILYKTKQVQNNYRSDQYVAAALNLFASVTTIFFYILRIMNRVR